MTMPDASIYHTSCSLVILEIKLNGDFWSIETVAEKILPYCFLFPFLQIFNQNRIPNRKSQFINMLIRFVYLKKKLNM
jgi:hypothetical protein